MRPPGNRRLLVAVLGAGLLAVPTACGGPPGGPQGGWGRGGEAKEEPKEQAAAVVTMKVARGPITAEITAASTIEAEQAVTVHAEATGRIISLEVQEGDEVKKGQVLARIKADAQASGLDRASTSLDRAQSDYDRVKQLFRQGAASQEELDAARATLDNAQIDMSDRRRDVRNTKIVAPFNGTITERFGSPGGFITSGAQLLSMTDFDTLVARVYVPEKELDRISEGQTAEVVGKAARGRRGTGTISRIAPIVDSTTGTVKVTIKLPEELSGGPKGFLPGMYAEVTLTTEKREDALLVPKQALVHDDDQAFVYVTDGNRVARRKVEVGLTSRAEAEILEGLEPGTEIVVIGQSGLKDNALIRRVDEAGNPLEPDPSGGDEKAASGPELANGSKANTAGESKEAKSAEGA